MFSKMEFDVETINEMVRALINNNSDSIVYSDGEFYCPDEGDVAYEVPNFKLHYGATKIVLERYFDDITKAFVEDDFVYKIPFSGHVCTDCLSCSAGCQNHKDYCKALDEWSKANAGKDSPDFTTYPESPCEDCSYEEYDYEYTRFTGADMDDSWSSHDYCARECRIGAAAVEAGLADVFLPTIYLGTFYGLPVYAQKKVSRKEYQQLNPSKASRDKFTKIMDSELWVIGSQLGGALIDSYGEEKTARIVDFVAEQGINDLHGGNFVQIDGKIIFFDYSGYYDN